jgi:hypothetical protein
MITTASQATNITDTPKQHHQQQQHRKHRRSHGRNAAGHSRCQGNPIYPIDSPTLVSRLFIDLDLKQTHPLQPLSRRLDHPTIKPDQLNVYRRTPKLIQEER